MTSAQRKPEPGQDADSPPDGAARMRADDISQLEELQNMAMSFATWLHDKGAEEMEKGGSQTGDRVRQLSNSFNKAARAVRQIMVLKHEMEGLRPTPHARQAVSGGGPANQNQPSRGGAIVNAGSTNGRSDLSMRERNDAYLDGLTEEEYEELETKADVWAQKLIDAFEIDLQAADPDIRADAEKQSTAIRLTRVASQIPHPNLDKAIVAIEMGRLWDMWGPRFAERPPDIGPPDEDYAREY
jgi:hypothetical protein